MLLKKSGYIKLVAIYFGAVALLYAGFWLGYYNLTNWQGVIISASLVVLSCIALAIFRDKTAFAIQLCVVVSFSLGMAISTFFVILKIEPSRFFGLVLLIMLGYKILQTFIISKIPFKKSFSIICIILEIIACTVFGVFAQKDAGLYSQIAFSCAVAVFLSFGQIALYQGAENAFWRTIALSFVLGFVYIVVIMVLIIISIASEDGSFLEVFGDGLTFGNNKKKKPNELLSIERKHKFK